MHISATTLVGLTLALATPALADGVTTSMEGSVIRSVSAGGTTFQAHELTPGTSSGEASWEHLDGFSIIAADEGNLAYYFARSTTAPEWSIDLGNWTNDNGSQHDFFVYEAGGNDAIMVAPQFPNGSYGQDTSIGGWTTTGYVLPTGRNEDENVFGIAFKSTQLRDANGSFVSANQALKGIRIRSAGIDGAAFLAYRPNPGGGAQSDGDASATLHGPRVTWQPTEIWFEGPWADQNADAPNPFLDYRLKVAFSHPSQPDIVVPGFFAGDGAEGGSGTIWKARFTPPRSGNWTATASFRVGTDVSISTATSPGSAGMLEGSSVTFNVARRDPSAPGFHRWGRLEYVGQHYPKFNDGPYFIKTGVNSPENFLGYRGFKNTGKAGGIGQLHDFEPHVSDWMPGDPNFTGNVHEVDARGIIGAINYLSSRGVNSIFAMLMNLGGDGQDAHPFTTADRTPYGKTHYDVGRMHQWNVIFEHAARKGIAMHFGLGETEQANENWLDNAQLGVERKLFYREMVARFAHLHAVKWTLCEENDFSVSNLRQFADYLGGQDAYDHPVTFHNNPNDFSDYNQVAGETRFEATSLQYHEDQASNQVEAMRDLSRQAGHRWIVQADENNPWQTGLTNSNATDLRRRVLYDVLFSGGHVEWYFGWFSSANPGGDLTVEDFRTRDAMFVSMERAREFMENHLPYWEMEADDNLVSGESSSYGGAEVFFKAGESYAVYYPSASTTGTIDLSLAGGDLQKRWFNPRTGTFQGLPESVQAGGNLAVGAPPSNSSEDWIVLFAKKQDLSGDVATISMSAGGTLELTVEPGVAYAGRNYWLLGSSTGTAPPIRVGALRVPLRFDAYTRLGITHANGSVFNNNKGSLDSQGLARTRIIFSPNAYPVFVGRTLFHAYVLLGPLDYASLPVSVEIHP
ncbi:MAG: hypothetical protein ACI8QZ_000474 [Chlamydiales bacterium]|jgi:hypothetical protein